MSSIAIAGGSSGRTLLTAAANRFISATGSDSNDGLTLGTAWATTQHAINVISGTLDFGGFIVNGNIGAGSFAGFGFKSCVGGGLIQFIGAGSGSTTITGGPNDGTFNFGDCIDIEVVSDTGLWITGVKFAIPTGLAGFECDVFNGNIGIGFQNSSALTDVKFAFPAGGGGSAIIVSNGAIMTLSFGSPFVGATLTFDGTAGGTQSQALRMANYGFIVNLIPWTITGTPAFSTAFLAVDSGGLFLEDQVTQPSGAATGPRFEVSTTGNIGQTTGSSLGPTWFPGNSAGTADAVSSYDGYFGPLPKINTQTGTPYTLAIGDLNKIVEMNNAGANTLTVPLNATVAFNIGAIVYVTQTGAGATTIAGAGGVTVDNAGVVGGQWKSVKLYKRGTDEWVQTNA